MWIFKSPNDYSEMVEKIAKCSFAISLILLYILSCANEDYYALLSEISFGGEYEFAKIKINLATLFLPLLIGILEHMFKLHDKMSDLLGIRTRYEKKYIVMPILRKSGFTKVSDEMLKKDVCKRIMSKCFYKYASSTQPAIDKHSIVLTLNEWCWYWIVLDTMLLTTVTGLFFLIFKWSLKNLLLIIGALSAMCILLFLVKRQTVKYTQYEIEAIFSDKERKNEIKKEIKQIPVIKDAL